MYVYVCVRAHVCVVRWVASIDAIKKEGCIAMVVRGCWFISRNKVDRAQRQFQRRGDARETIK